jgi:hypothetical protein
MADFAMRLGKVSAGKRKLWANRGAATMFEESINLTHLCHLQLPMRFL